jgi:hypothetical protein
VTLAFRKTQVLVLVGAYPAAHEQGFDEARTVVANALAALSSRSDPSAREAKV